MSVPHPGARAVPRPRPSALALTPLPLTAAARFGESRPRPAPVLLDVRWLGALLLSLLPLLAAAQDDPPERRYAVGLRFTPTYTSSRGADQLLRNTDLSFRARLDDRWSLEATAGYWRRGDSRANSIGAPVDRGLQRLQFGLTVQRDWRLRNPRWTAYAGGGLGALYVEQRGLRDAAGGSRDASAVNLTVLAVGGLRYRLPRAPLELDLGLRPRYGGRGFGLELRPSVGLRYRFGE